MTFDWLSPTIILLSVLIYGVLHTLLASFRIKDWASNRYGEIANRFYRLIYNILAVLTLLPVLALVPILPDQILYTLPFPWIMLTIGLQLFAILVLLIGLLQTGLWSFLGLAQFVMPPSKGNDQLVIHGLYRWVRHPLYTAGLVIIWLTPVMSVNLFALYLGLSIYIVVGAMIEERKLLAEYGPSYSEYKQRTSFLIPLPPRTKQPSSN